MFFLGLTATLILFISGIVLLLKSSYVAGGILLGIGLIFFVAIYRYYRKKRRGSASDKLDCGLECLELKLPKKLDCDCADGLDCDCTPDCSP